MNWKINFWTLLFAITALGFLIYAFTRPTCPPSPIGPDLCVGEPDTLTHNEAAQRYIDYNVFLEFYLLALYQAAEKDSILKARIDNISNMDVRSFHIPRCELNEMLAQRPDGDVSAYLMLEDDPTPGNEGKKRISLMFYDKPLVADLSEESLNDGDDDGTFYDFTAPCPTSCNGGQ